MFVSTNIVKFHGWTLRTTPTTCVVVSPDGIEVDARKVSDQTVIGGKQVPPTLAAAIREARWCGLI